MAASFMSCSSRYFNGIELVFLRCADSRWSFSPSLAKTLWRLMCKNESLACKNFPTEVIFLLKCYTTWCCVREREALEPNAHSSRLTRSRCLASETSYWLVFMFFSTFLFTSSTCLPCSGCSCAECLFSWSRSTATWPGETGTCGIPLLSLFGPGSSEPLTAGDCSAVTLAYT